MVNSGNTSPVSVRGLKRCTVMLIRTCTRCWEVTTTLYFKIYFRIVAAASNTKCKLGKQLECFPASKQTTAGPPKRGQRLLLTHKVITGRKGRHAGAWACTWQCLTTRYGCAILICIKVFLEGNRNSRKRLLQHRRKKKRLKRRGTEGSEQFGRNCWRKGSVSGVSGLYRSSPSK